MKVCFWSTSFQADSQALACYLASQPDFEVVVAMDHPRAYREEAVESILPFTGVLLDRQAPSTRKTLKKFGADVVIVDNHAPTFKIAPRVLVLWHGFGWRVDDISGMRADLRNLVGDVTAPNPNFRWQAFGDWDRNYTINHRRIARENVVTLGSAYSDLLLPSSPARQALDASETANGCAGDFEDRKTVLVGATWHHSGLFDRAATVVEAMIATHPENPIGVQIMNFIHQRTGG